MVNKRIEKFNVNVRLDTLYYLVGKEAATEEDIFRLTNVRDLKELKRSVPNNLIEYCDVINKEKTRVAKEFWEIKQQKLPVKKSGSKSGRKPSPKISLLNPVHIYVLIKRAEYDYNRDKPIASFSRLKLKEWLDSKQWKEELFNPDYFYFELPKILKQFGVAFVPLPYVSGSVHGFITWSYQHPIICVTDKYHDHISCWITFLHLCCHACDQFCEGKMLLEPRLLTYEQNYDRDYFADFKVSSLLFNGSDLGSEFIGYPRPEINTYKLAQKYKVDERIIEYLECKSRRDYTNHSVKSLHFKNHISKFIFTGKTDMDENEIIRNNIKVLIKKRGVKVFAFAEEIGLSYGHVSKLLNGKREFKLVILRSIALYFGISVEDLKTKV